jgi:hypothetical protein
LDRGGFLRLSRKYEFVEGSCPMLVARGNLTTIVRDQWYKTENSTVREGQNTWHNRLHARRHVDQARL